jgi:hypothetical protein
MHHSRLFLAGLGLIASAALAQGTGVPPAVIVTPAEFNAALKSAPPTQAEFNKIVKPASAANAKVSVDINKRIRAEERGIVHDRVTEVYTIIEGGGTLLTGGTLIDPKPMKLTGESSIGPSQVGSSIHGGESKHVGVGDVVVIPAGTPHMFTALDGTVVYSVLRFDPAH